MKKYLYLHKFFIEESKSYMKGTNKIEYYTKFPFAYIKFMYYSFI